MSGKLPENNPWSTLSTVNSFDKGNHSWTTRCMDDSEVRAGGQIVGRVAPSTSLLIESLIQQLCTMFEGDTVRRNKLYFAICDRLHEMKLIDGSYNKREFETVRGQYQIALYKLVAVARASTGSESPLQVPKYEQLRTKFTFLLQPLYSKRSKSCLMAEWSRYRREFQEICFIAAGGFGSVFKSLHRLDGNEYAVKKIVVHSGRVKTIMKHLEEVKTIAKLNHTNIVSYKGAWIESTFPATFVPSSETFADYDNNRDRGKTDLSTSFQKRRRKSQSCRVSGKSKRESASKSNETRHSESKHPGENNKPNEREKFTYKTGMYISIESKCETAARRGSSGGYVISHDIINERFQQLNSTNNIIGERISETVSSRIVEDDSDIVSFRNETQEGKINDTNGNSAQRNNPDGMDYTEEPDDSDSPEEAVSERRIIQYTRPSQQYATLYIQMGLCDETLRQWMDARIEPTPIPFVTEILTQILSGLQYIHSCGIVHHDVKPSNIFISTSANPKIQLGDFGLACPLQREHPSMLGTPTYAAPEQLNGKCDPKSDVYSLGIVLLELLLPMQTSMERSRVITALKSGQIPATLSMNHPKWAQVINQLVQEDPHRRPSTAELLKTLREDKDSLIAKLTEENERKDHIIVKLKEENKQKDDAIAKVTDEYERRVKKLQDKIAQLESKSGEFTITLDNT